MVFPSQRMSTPSQDSGTGGKNKEKQEITLCLFHPELIIDGL
jgi:hypothetical protein